MSATTQATRTEIVFVLDASGSMCPLTDDTIGGFNSMIDKNRDEPGEALVTTVIFNSGSRTLHDRMDIREVPRLTREQYCCTGCTALLDAVGEAISRQEIVQSVLPAPYRAERVLFVITTDGMENASHRYTYEKVKELIERHREAGWEFLFIGANIDAAAEAGRMGIDRGCAANYVPDQRGTEVLYDAVGAAVAGARCAAPHASMPSGWRDALDRDYRRRIGGAGNLFSQLADRAADALGRRGR